MIEINDELVKLLTVHIFFGIEKKVKTPSYEKGPNTHRIKKGT